MASLSGVWNAQEFTDAGLLLVGGRLYTYAAGTTTHKTAYTDAAAAVPQTYTSDGIGGQYIALDSRGELPAPLFLASGGYDLALKRADGSTVWTRRAIGQDDATPAAGQVGFVYGNTYPSGSVGKWLKDLATSTGASLIGFLQSGTGAVLRTAQAKLRDQVSVMDFGAVGDGVTDDTAAIQAAQNTGKKVYFPKPTAFYKTTSAIQVAYTCHWHGENGLSTIIRNTSGSGSVIDLQAAVNERTDFADLRIGGSGCTGLTVQGGVYTAYASMLSLKRVHFEADLAVCLKADLIHADLEDSTFGYYIQTAASAGLIHIQASGAGALNTNVNSVRRCRFFRGGAAVFAVQITQGIMWRFADCAWELGGRAMQTSNVQNLILDNCYIETCTAPGAFQGLFTFGAARTRVKVIGGYYNGNTLGVNQAMFSYGGSTTPLVIEDADIAVNTNARIAYDNQNVTFAYPNQLLRISNCRVAGNAADPVVTALLDGNLETFNQTYTPTVNNLTVVNGTGGATTTGSFTVIGNRVFWEILITTTGTATTASAFGSTTMTMPGQYAPKRNSSFSVLNTVSGADLGTGRAATNGTLILPAWAAQAGSIVLSGSYPA